MTIKLFLQTAALGLAPSLLFAQAGTLDGDFDGDGRVTTAILSGESRATSVAVQPNGFIVAAGSTITAGAGASTNFGIVRYRPDGSLDNTFSLNGEADFGIATAAADDAEAVAILPDGKILAAGNSASGTGTVFSALLLNPGGTSFDVSFGNNGKILFENEDFVFRNMALQPDGKIVAVGYSNNGDNFDFKVLRLNANGSLDNTFSSDGRMVIPVVTGANDFARDVALQPDGKILVVGTSTAPDRAIALIRLNANGGLDNTFSFDGKLTTLIGAWTDGNAVLVQSDGKIVVAGQRSESVGGTSKDMVMVRYQADGLLDPTFDSDGRSIITLPGDDSGVDVLRQSDGKLILIGSVPPNNGMVAARLFPNGALDLDFGNNGIAVADFDDFATPAQAAFTPNNRLVIVGHIKGENTDFDFAVAQFLLGLIVGVEDLGLPGAQLVYPNPIDNQAVFQYELPQAGQISLSLLDLQGRLLHVFLSNETRPSGPNTETLRFPPGLSAGNYVLQLRTEAGNASVKIQKR